MQKTTARLVSFVLLLHHEGSPPPFSPIRELFVVVVWYRIVSEVSERQVSECVPR